MGTINTKARPKQVVKHEKVQEEQGHKNWMGGTSYSVGDPVFNLRLAASSCFFGEPMYYHSDEQDKRPRRETVCSRRCSLSARGLAHLRKTLNAIDPQEWRDLSPTALMEKAVDDALAADVIRTLEEAVRLRSQEHIRTTPQVIMVRAANHAAAKGTGLVRQYGRKVIARADELAVQLAYQMHRYGKPIPNSLKKAWKAAFENFNDYQLAKYRMEGRSVKLVDVMNLCHPSSDAVSKLAAGKQKNTNQTWEALASKAGEDAAKADNEKEKKAIKQKSWKKSIEKMGHMALLRNLRNLIQNEVDHREYVGKLVDTAAQGKQLPFRYYSAYRAVEDTGRVAPVLDAIEECLEQSIGNLPVFPGRTMSLCDFSGSAAGATTSAMGTMRVCDIGALCGVLTARASEEGGSVGVFGDSLKYVDIRKKASVFDALKAITKCGRSIGGNTENGIWLFFDNAIKKKEHWDNIFIYSDMQAGHGGLYGVNEHQYRDYRWLGSRYIDVARLVLEYRMKVNPDVNVFCVQTAGYQDTLIPEFYDRTYILGGWGPGLLSFASEMITLRQ